MTPRDNGSDRNGGDALAAPCGASQSGARSAIAQTTEPAQPFNPWLDRLQDGEKPPEPLPEDAAFEAAIERCIESERRTREWIEE